MNVWQQILNRLQATISRHAFETWFQPTALIADNGTVIVVSVPNPTTSEWLQRHFAISVSEALAQVDRCGVSVEYVPTDVAAHQGDTEPARLRPIVRRLADVQPQAVKWRWPGRLADGKLALLVGDPGLGKSFVTLDIAARISNGRPWPDLDGSRAPADVLLLSAEDGVADTIRPRIEALGGDLRRVHTLEGVRRGELERLVQLTDIAALEDALKLTGARTLFIDPLSAYLGRTDSHRDSEVRGLLAPVAALAERTGVAVLAVMHLSKNAHNPAIYRAVGSIAFGAAPRIVLGVAKDPNKDDRRLLFSVKSNLCSSPGTLAYTISQGCLLWEPVSFINVNVDALLCTSRTLNREARETAAAWLCDLLADGPVASDEVEANRRMSGISRRTLFRAKHDVGVKVYREGFGAEGTWYWTLIQPKSATKGATQGPLAPNGPQ